MMPARLRLSTLNAVKTRHVEPLHLGDLRIRAWAPTREECLAEAVHAMVVTFVGRVPPYASTVDFDVFGDTNADLLVGVLRTVIFRIGKWNEFPVATDVTGLPAGLRVHCAMADLGLVIPVGAV